MKRISVLAAIAILTTVGFRRPTADWPTAVAQQQRFTERVVESGSITSQQMRLYASTIAGAPAKIVELAPEGRAVQAGDLLIRFDASGFLQNRDTERAALRRAEADLANAREDLHLEGLRADEDLAAAQQNTDSARRDLANEREGRGAIETVTAEAAAAEATREVARTRTALEEIRPLLAEGFVTRNEVDRAEQALQRAQDQERVAITKRDALLAFERPAAIGKAETALNVARDSLVRQAETALARVTQRRAAVALASGRADEIRARLVSLDMQIARTEIRADGPGLVVYRQIFFGNEPRKPQVGDEVFPNQPIVAIPDSSQFAVETRIRETDLHKVTASQRVLVRTDAYPDLTLPATVMTVGALAEADTTRAAAKFFPVMVTLTASDPRLRTGMTARVEIEVASIPTAVTVPVEALFEDQGSRYVVVARDGRPERRSVGVVGTNEDVAAVAGLAAGETVWLSDPTSPVR